MLPIARGMTAVTPLMPIKISRELGWKPQETFESGIRKRWNGIWLIQIGLRM